MQSNYKRLGDYIQEVKVKNTDLKATLLLGINIDKFFMPSVANVVGTDMATYRVVNKNQFACNRMHVGRDYRIPIALSNKEVPFMVSPAYDVFEIIDPSFLLPEYLMMWFSRKEFDRNASFHTDADVRGGLPWKLFCDLKLPIPSPEKQLEIVREYNVIQNRIKLNNQLIAKLEDAAQAIYKQWFVDFEFPDENGLPYKSNGGEMVESELGEIPKGWDIFSLESLILYKKGNPFKSEDYTNSGIPIVRVSDLSNNSIDLNQCYFLNANKASRYKEVSLRVDDIIITSVGSWPSNPASVVGKVVKVPIISENALLNQNMVRLITKDEDLQLVLYTALRRKEFSDFVIAGAQGSANQASVTLKHLFSHNLILPNCLSNLSYLFEAFQGLYKLKNIKEKELTHLAELQNIISAKMTKVEIEKEFA